MARKFKAIQLVKNWGKLRKIEKKIESGENVNLGKKRFWEKCEFEKKIKFEKKLNLAKFTNFFMIF